MATPETKPVRLLAAAVLLALTAPSLRAEVPEPETVFYGRVVNRTTAQEFQLTSGTLTVVVVGESGAPLVVSTRLEPHAGGKYSYVLRLPHQAKSLDLKVDEGILPLRSTDASFESANIQVDGRPARPFGLGATTFLASQPRRGGVHRLDLEVFEELADSDSDGIPDWWEDLHGLDKQDPGDALLRWGDNRYTYLEAFLLGLDPGADDSVPELLTAELMVMEGGATGLLPRAAASVSSPRQIAYRITALPEGGELVLRNARRDPRRSLRQLGLGDSFTQAEVNAGLLEFVHKDPSVTATRLGVALSQGNPEVEPVEREVELRVFSPDASEGRAGEALLQVSALGGGAAAPSSLSARATWLSRATEAFADDWIGGARKQDWIAAFLLARRHGYTVWDGSVELPTRNLTVPSAGLNLRQYNRSYLPDYGSARSHVVFAGNGTSRIEGGMNHDILVAGRGETTLRGNGGADIFVVSEGITLIEDFTPGENDILDLSPLLQGWPGPLDGKVEVSAGSGDTWLRVPLGEEEEAIVVLQGRRFNAGQLEDLRRRGRVFTGAPAGAAPEANRPPVAVADEGYVTGDGPVTIAVLANDLDPDGDSLSITRVTQGSFGTVQLFGDIVVYNPGHAFSGADEFTYTLSDGRGGTATGLVRISYPFPAAAGRYLPLVFDGEGRPVGRLDLTLRGGGGFSASLVLGGRRYSGRGVFDGDGAATVSLRSRGRTVELSLSFDFSDPSYPLAGSLSGPSVEGTLATSTASADHRLAPTEVKRFTFATEPPEDQPGIAGFSAARVGISRRYVATVAGHLADGTPFTGSAVQDGAGGIAWSTGLYRGGGWLVGQLSLDQSRGAVPSGSLVWTRSEGRDPAFTVTLPASVSPYVPPGSPAASALDFLGEGGRRADFLLHEGGLPRSLETGIAFRNRDLIRADDPGVLLRVNRQHGLFFGSVRIDGSKRRIHGAILQDRNAGYGVFINGAAAGAVELYPR